MFELLKVTVAPAGFSSSQGIRPRLNKEPTSVCMILFILLYARACVGVFFVPHWAGGELFWASLGPRNFVRAAHFLGLGIGPLFSLLLFFFFVPSP